MLKVNSLQTNFTSGELSPWLLGRSDVERFISGGEKIENFLVRHQGGILYRPGAKKVGLAAAQGTGDVVRVIDFVFSRTDAIAIEVSEGKFRFIRNDEYIMDGNDPYEVTGTPYLNQELFELQFAQSADVLYIVHPNHPPATLSRTADTDWSYDVLDFRFGPYMDQEQGDQDISLHLAAATDRMTLRSTNATEWTGRAPNDYVEYAVAGQRVLGRIVTVTSAQEIIIEPLEDRCLTLSKEVYSPGVYLGWDNTNSVPTYSQTFSGTVTVAFSATAVVTQENIGSYLRFADSTGTYRWLLIDSVGDIVKQGAYGILATGAILTVYGSSGIVTRKNRSTTSVLTASATGFFHTTNDVGRMFRLVLGGTVVHATATSAVSNTVMNVSLNRTLPRTQEGLVVVDAGTTNDWNRGAWYKGNYPGAICFHEERLCFGGSIDQPQTIWMSKSGDLDNFAATDELLAVQDDSAITLTIASDTVNQILWMSSRKVLCVGTVGGEWTVSAGGTSEAMTPLNVSVQHQSNFGSEFIRPVTVATQLLYVQRGGHKIRQMSYDYQNDGQLSLDLNVFANHVLKDHDGAVAVAYQHLPESALYVLCNDGQIAVLTYEPDQKVYAWSRIILGGDGIAESITCLPYQGVYRLYIVVRRTILEETVRTIEVMEPDFNPESNTDWTTSTFLDNWRYYYYAGTTAPATLINLDDLAGLTVWCIVGSHFFRGTVNENGELSVPSAVTRTNSPTIRVGLQYDGWFKGFPIETQALAGTGQAKVKRINHISVRLLNSGSFSHGLDEGDMRQVDFRVASDPVNMPPPLRTEDYRVSFANGFDVRGQFNIKQTGPYPLCILAIYPELAQYQ